VIDTRIYTYNLCQWQTSRFICSSTSSNTDEWSDVQWHGKEWWCWTDYNAYGKHMFGYRVLLNYIITMYSVYNMVADIHSLNDSLWYTQLYEYHTLRLVGMVWKKFFCLPDLDNWIYMITNKILLLIEHAMIMWKIKG